MNTINITPTRTCVANDIHSFSLVDIGFTGTHKKGFVNRNTSDPKFISAIKALNPQTFVWAGSDTCAGNEIVSLNNIPKGDGYNIDPEFTKSRGLSMDTFLDGVGDWYFGKDFYEEATRIAIKVDCRMDIILNAICGDQNQYNAQIKDHPTAILFFGLHAYLKANADIFPTVDDYLKKYNALRPGPMTMELVAATPPAKKSTPNISTWKDGLNKSSAGSGVLSLWPGDYISITDSMSFLEIMDAYIDYATNQIPQAIKDFYDAYPNLNPYCIEWGIGGGNGETDKSYGTIAACLFIGLFHATVINYNLANSQGLYYAAFMTLKKLFDASNAISCIHYNALQLVGMLYNADEFAPVGEITIEGLRDISCAATITSEKVTLLMVNTSGEAKQLEALYFDGKMVSKFYYQSIWNSSLDLKEVKSCIGNALGAMPINPYSITIITFPLMA